MESGGSPSGGSGKWTEIPLGGLSFGFKEEFSDLPRQETQYLSPKKSSWEWKVLEAEDVSEDTPAHPGEGGGKGRKRRL